jgi:hypothetical protein
LKTEEEYWYDSLLRVNNETGIPQKVFDELESFRYFKCSHHPYGTNADALDVCISYNGEVELDNIITTLEVDGEFERLDNSVKVTRKQTGYKHLDNRPFTPLIFKPGLFRAKGKLVYLQITEDTFIISVNTKEPKFRDYHVTNEHISVAKFFETVLNTHKFVLVDPPIDIKNYVCPKYHSDFFS